MTVETLHRVRYCRGCGCWQPHKSHRLRPEPSKLWWQEWDDKLLDRREARDYALLHNLLVGWNCCVCRRWSLWGRSR